LKRSSSLTGGFRRSLAVCTRTYMTLPNILTVSRLALAPVFVALLVVCDQAGIWRNTLILLLWVVYALIELSDLADGFFARLLKQESELGKLLDPFADSLSRLSCFLAFTVVGLMPLWIFLIVLYRDLWVSFIRVTLAKRGIVQGARLAGKIKAWVYAIANGAALAAFTAQRVLPFMPVRDILFMFCLIGFYCVAVIALWSGIDYSTMLFNRKDAQKK
jgi:CDP-diacylglycerol--glycerol-3-phosphate 3-phosphatidyltransferase